MSYLADTNILLRLLEPGTLLCQQARQAITWLHSSGETVSITPQIIIEFWNGATRPITANGFGLTPAQADAEVRQIEKLFPLLPESPAIYQEWRRLVTAHNVIGVQVHDARLAAVMQVHSVAQVLTFNVRDFHRFPGITVVHPAQLPAADETEDDASPVADGTEGGPSKEQSAETQ